MQIFLTENTNHRRYMEWKLSLLKAVTFVSFLTSCFHLCLSAYSVLQEVLCKYSRWGVGGEQALHLWTAESERDVRRRHSRLFKKKKERKTNKKMWICSRSLPSGRRRSQTCDRANTVLLVSSFTASAITTKKSKVFCTYTFWPLLHGKADF